ncbi:MAG: UDP-N-acetylmuramate dehydrogenase [bacterium]|nr:UDP-N-acetylmuramate dehydrogenase [bacterium]
MISLQENVSLASYTIYNIGGPARFFVDVKNADDLREAIIFAQKKNLRFVILGAGSNTLVSDKGFNGLAIRMTGGSVTVEGDKIHADAGVMMARAVIESGRASLHGFEWGIGVPGTIGGSVRGNAGCFGGEMKDVVESVEVFDSQTATSYKLQATNCAFGYRDSVFKTHPEWIIVSVTLKLCHGDPQEIQKEIQRITQERVAKQDIGSKCCGCIFKNAEWPHDANEREALILKFPELAVFRDRATIPSAFLIDHAGLKGTEVGNVCISDKHANFFINKGGGTSGDVMALIALTKKKVKEKFGIELHEEIYIIGL